MGLLAWIPQIKLGSAHTVSPQEWDFFVISFTIFFLMFAPLLVIAIVGIVRALSVGIIKAVRK